MKIFFILFVKLRIELDEKLRSLRKFWMDITLNEPKLDMKSTTW